MAVASTEPQLVTMLQIAQSQVRNKDGSFTPITILLDSGSDRTYVRNDLVQKAGLQEVSKANIAYSSFGGEREPKAKLRSVVTLELIDMHGIVLSLNAVGVDTICQPIKRAALSGEALRAFKHLSPLTTNYAESPVSTIDLLIGLDQYWSLINERQTVRHHNLVAQATRFGYIISGSYTPPLEAGYEATAYEAPMTHTQLLVLDLGDQRAEQIWKLDTIGILPTETKVNCLDQNPIYQQLISELEYDKQSKRYKAPLLWKGEAERLRLANNYKQAEARLENLHRRTLDPDPQLSKSYYNIIEQWICEGKVEIIPEGEITIKGQPTYYLPHRPVLRPQASSSQVRPVFDASSKTYTGYSLNDLCHTGPSLLPDLFGVLLRFRRWKWVISGDVRQAFLNIFIKDVDRDVHRFLIKRGENIIHCRFTVLPFGNTCSPFILQGVLNYHFKTFNDSPATRELLNNLYMDNILTGADSQEEAENLYQTFCHIFSLAGMQLDKWSTNNEGLQAKLLLDNRQPTSHKILGVEWDKEKDSFVFKGVIHQNLKLPLNKRSVLSILGSFFDPLGLISPFILVGKIIFQQIWTLNIDWDTPLPEHIALEFNNWLNSSRYLNNLSVSRQYFPDLSWRHQQSDVQVVAFGDASETAYGTVVYLRVKRGDSYQVSLAASRSRVAPLSGLTLPRLELMAALTTARLAKTICDELNLAYSQVSYFSDSEIVLHWINSKTPFKFRTFVCNRISEILRLSSPSQWHHCSGLSNPADISSRGLYGEELAKNRMWLQGPLWLQRYDSYPSNKILPPLPETVDLENLEIKANTYLTIETVLDNTFAFERIGKFSKAINSLAYVYRVLNRCKFPRSEWKQGPLSAEEMASAMQQMWRLQQNTAFKQERECLEQGKNLPKGSALTRLNPFICDKGLLRVGGRLKNAALPEREKCPIILKRSHITLLLARDRHLKSNHAGLDTLQAYLSKEYHIISLRPMLKFILRYCIQCQKINKRMCNVIYPPLPSFRVTPARPFEKVGIDFAGPMHTKGSPKKYYFLIIVCSVVRAIHLELTSGINLQELQLALSRFCSRRGVPTLIVSDNAPTFTSAAGKMTQWFGDQAPKWNHIAPRAPWWGGCYERHIKTVKTSLKKTIGKSRLTNRQLETLLISIEGSINDRPLLLGYNNCILTPRDFINPPFLGEGGAPPKDLNGVFENQQATLKEFW